MNIEDLSREDLIRLTKAMSEGRSFDDIALEFVSNEFATVVYNLHSIMCKDKHNPEGTCKLYFEDRGDWKSPAHQAWLSTTNLIFDKYLEGDFTKKISTITGILRYVGNIEHIKEEVGRQGGEKAVDLLLLLINPR